MVLARQYVDLCDKSLPAKLVIYISIVILMIGNVSLVSAHCYRGHRIAWAFKRFFKKVAQLNNISVTKYNLKRAFI